VTCGERKGWDPAQSLVKLPESQVAGGVTKRCMAGTDTLGSASEVGFNEVGDRADDSETGVKSG
jgi:hypothetical protein